MRQQPEHLRHPRASRAPTTVSARPLDAAAGHQSSRAAGLASLASAWDSVAFLKGFFRHPDQVGSVIPSSAVLEAHLVRAARLEDARSVVELGPGTGGTTRAFLRALPARSKLLAIELSPMFHARISALIKDPRFTPQLGSAEQIAEFLAAWRMPAADAVISGIPFSTMPVDVADRIAAAVASALAPGGRFVAYQVRAHVAQFATPYLGEPVRQWQWFNIPPVRVFTWTKPPR